MPQLLRLCLTLCRERQEAEDLLQESLVRAFVLLFMPLIALVLGFLVGRRFDSAWAMLGTVTVCFVAGGTLFPGEPFYAVDSPLQGAGWAVRREE